MLLLIIALFFCAISLSLSKLSIAQDFPTKPIRLLVPFAAGGPIDLLSRTIANKLTETIGQSVIIENRPGAGGSIAADATARSAPDGYTIMLITVGTQAINPALYKLKYDSLQDFSYITTVGTYSLVLVANPKLPFKTIAELIAYARTNPGKLNYGSSGHGSTAHLAAELLKSSAGIDVQHVAYKGSAAALSEVMAGNINYVFDIISTALPQIQSGAVRALGWTGVTRSSLIPNVPTIAEAGLPGFDITGWVGIAGPSGIPANVLQRLHAAVSAAIKDADLRGRIMGQGYAIDLIEPAAFYALVKADLAKWGKVVRDGNIKVE